MRDEHEALSRFMSRLLVDRGFREAVRKDPHGEAAPYGLTEEEIDLALDGDVSRLVAAGVDPALFEPAKPKSFWLAPAVARMSGAAAALLLAFTFMGAAPDNPGSPRARIAVRRAGASGRYVVHPTTVRAADVRAARAGARRTYYTSSSWDGSRTGGSVRAGRRARFSPFGSYASQDDALAAIEAVWPDIKRVGGDEQEPPLPELQ